MESPKAEEFLFSITPTYTANALAGYPNHITLILNTSEATVSSTRLTVSYGDGVSYTTTSGIPSTTYWTNNPALVEGRHDHIYNLPGEYHVQLALADNGAVLKDTILSVGNPPKTVGSKDDYEFPLDIWQLPNSEYRILYEKSIEHTSASFWSEFRISADFDSVGDVPLVEPNTQHGKERFVDNEGNLSVYRPPFLERYSPMGEVLWSVRNDNNSVSPATGFRFVDGEYVVATGGTTSGNYVTRLDTGGAIISTKLATPWLGGSGGIFPLLTDGGDIVSGFDNGSVTTVFVHDRFGEQKMKKEFNFGLYSIYSVPDGFLIVTKVSTGYQFVKIDLSGEIKWTVPVSFSSYPGGYFEEAVIQPIAVGEDTYIFYEYMKAIRIDTTGRVVWQRDFMIEDDRFQCAVLNNAGNFTVVGIRTFSSPKMIGQTEYFADVVLTEIDKQGNLIEH